MKAVASTRQRAPLISLQVCASLLIALFFFGPHPLVISLAQSEEPRDKKPTPTPAPLTATLRPKVTYRESAIYTEDARDNLVHGIVALSVVFGVDGQISGVKVVRGLPYGLTVSAIEAAKKVRFEPAMKDGQPLSVRGILEFSFDLHSLDETSIRTMLRNDFPVLSEEVVKVMATEIYKRRDNETRKAWQYGQQRLENGLRGLPQSEQEELMSLTLEAIRGLDGPDQQRYQGLADESKTGPLIDHEQMRMNELRFGGIARLPNEKRERAGALYNKAAALGTKLP